LPGTATLLVRRYDGRNFAILFNARSSPSATHFGQAIDPQLHTAIDQIDEWPEHDLFNADTEEAAPSR
jgi:N-acyl-D-amino-acid deacylase